MDSAEKKRLLDILEIDHFAGPKEIEAAYRHLTRLYSNIKSPELLPIADELDENEINEILSSIREAYEKLAAEMPVTEEIKLEQDDTYDFNLFNDDEKEYSVSGEYFRRVREKKDMKIKDIAELLDIPFKLLGAIESEKFSKFNNDGYLRWLIIKYAGYLGIDKMKAAEDYMKLYRSKK